MSEGLAVEQRDGVTLLRMRFGRANALGPEVVDVLSTAISELAMRSAKGSIKSE